MCLTNISWIFIRHFSPLIYKSTTKSANQNISTRGYLFQVVKEIVSSKEKKLLLTEILPSIIMWSPPASVLSCGYLNSQRNHIQGSTIQPISSVTNLVKPILGLLLIHTNHHSDSILFSTFLFNIWLWETTHNVSLLYHSWFCTLNHFVLDMYPKALVRSHLLSPHTIFTIVSWGLI